MASIDVLVETEFPDDVLGAAVAAVLQKEREKVLVINDVSEYPPTDGDQAVCNVQRFNDGFQQAMTIDYPHDFNVDQFIHGIAMMLRTRCLVPANNPNPYSMRLFTVDGAVTDVFVDASTLDNKGDYLIT